MMIQNSFLPSALLLCCIAFITTMVVDAASVSRFVLVNDQGDELHEFVGGIDEGYKLGRDTLYYDDLGTRNLSIMVETAGDDVSYVNFKFNGKVYPDTDVPFAMQDNTADGGYNAVPYLATASPDFSIRANIHSADHSLIGSGKLRFIIADGSNPTNVPVPAPTSASSPLGDVPVSVSESSDDGDSVSTKLILVEAGTSNRIVQEINNGAIIDLADFDTQLTILSVTDTVDKIQVRFYFNGRTVVENVSPYVMTGNVGSNYHAATYLAIAGTKSVQADVYRNGNLIDSVTRLFDIVDSSQPAVAAAVVTADDSLVTTPSGPIATTLTLVEAGTSNTKLTEIVNGATINLSDFGNVAFTAVAETTASAVTQIQFEYNNQRWVENVGPYVMHGNAGGYYNPESYLNSVGSKEVTVLVYSGDDLIDETTIGFTLTEKSTAFDAVAAFAASMSTPVSAPVSAPVPAPVSAPVPALTEAPVLALTEAPVAELALTEAPIPVLITETPVPAPALTEAPVPVLITEVPVPALALTEAPVPVLITEAPVPAITRAPVLALTEAPAAASVAVPVPAPVAAPVPAPVAAPVPAPVVAPVPAPVASPLAVMEPVSSSGAPRVGTLRMVDVDGNTVHTFVKGIDEDFVNGRDTIKFSEIGTNQVTIVADLEGDISEVSYVRFTFNGKTYPDRSAPFALQDNDGDKFNPVLYLSTPSPDRSIRASLFTAGNQELASTKLRFIME